MRSVQIYVINIVLILFNPVKYILIDFDEVISKIEEEIYNQMYENILNANIEKER